MAKIILVVTIFIIALLSWRSGYDHHIQNSTDSEVVFDSATTLENQEPLEETPLPDLSTINGSWKLKKIGDTTGDYFFVDTMAMLATLASFPVKQTVTRLQVKLDSAEVERSGLSYYMLRYNKMLDGSDLHDVNFAGRYILCTSGCGTECVASWIIDAVTGKIQKGRTAASGFFALPKSRLLLQDPDYRTQYSRPRAFYMCDDGVLRETTIEPIRETK